MPFDMRIDPSRLVLICLALAFAVAPSHRAAAADSRIPMFKTPSGNIVCAYYNRSIRCDIRSGLSPTPTRPRGCPSYSDFGQGLNLGPRRAGVVCAGDTVLGGAPVLAYGRAWRRGPITCRSRIMGLTCKNTLGHGFFLSRQTWRLF
jgi:uncharacterized protein DUF6636